jgi:membrane associated rhomboid family serine protease
MLADRPYMRETPGGHLGRRRLSGVAWLLLTLGAIFLLQTVLVVWFNQLSVQGWGALSMTGLRAGRAWTLLTYAGLHHGVLHLLLNAYGLYIFGVKLEAAMGPRRLLGLTLTAALFGAVGWLSVNGGRAGSVVGASGVLMGYMGAYAYLFPWRRMRTWFFNLSYSALTLALATMALDVLGLVFWEIPGRPALIGFIAHSAHLGGVVGGVLFCAVFLRTIKHSNDHHDFLGTETEPAEEAPLLTVAAPVSATHVQAEAAGTTSAAHPSSRAQLKTDYDRILDKINISGMGALTSAEKKRLQEASALLKRD